jgi:hypothetical protein
MDLTNVGFSFKGLMPSRIMPTAIPVLSCVRPLCPQVELIRRRARGHSERFAEVNGFGGIRLLSKHSMLDMAGGKKHGSLVDAVCQNPWTL